MPKAINPMSEYLLKLQLIITNTVFMNIEEAQKYETADTKINGGAYVNAILKKDTWDSYEWNASHLKQLFVELQYPEDSIRKYLQHPEFIPWNIKNILLEKARQYRIETYQEPNKYYLNLNGKPLESVDPLIKVPDAFVSLYQEKGVLHFDQYIHTMPKKYQELFMNSPYYQQILTEYPDVEYVKHLGSYSIPLEVSRKARDGDILLINESKLQTYHEIFGNVTVSSDIVHAFVSVYKKTQRYVYNTLRGDFSQIYPNYNSFIRFLTIYLTIGGCMNEFMHKSTKLIYMNDAIANDYFSLYGLPSVLTEATTLTTFLKKFRLLLMDKGTNVVYRVKDLIGYEYTDIYTLVMVKQQVFKNGYPVYYTDTDGVKHPQQEIVFRRLGTAEDNASYFQFRDSKKTYTVEEITSGDPHWWNTPEVERMIQEMNYTLSNSKYIQLSTAMSMDDIWWQCCILLRGLLDHKNETKFTTIGISQSLNGTSNVSIFEATLILIILMNWNKTDFNGRCFSGDLYLPNGTYDGLATCVDMLFNGLYEDGSPKPLIPGLPYKVASFNFDIKETDRNKYDVLQTYGYLDPDTFIPMLDRILDREDTNIGETIMTNVKLLFQYLETKLRTASTIHEFRQVTDAYNWLFLVDPNRNWSDVTMENTEQLLLESYGITMADLMQLKRFFYGDHTSNGNITVTYLDQTYQISIYDIMNQNVLTLEDYPFSQSAFLTACHEAIDQWNSNVLENSEISNLIKANYKSIIKDKIMLDVSNFQYGPTSFEALLYLENPSLYRALQTMKSDGEQLLLLMRSIIRALETYTNHPLTSLEFNALGHEQYIFILKEVITYFKSYMVEFTKEEFRYLFGGLFDHGGNSDMLGLFDENNHIQMRMLPRDATHLYDVSCAKVRFCATDDVSQFFYDEALFRIKTTYKQLKETNYEIWYDNGEYIGQTPFDTLRDNDIVIADVLNGTNAGTYKIVINIENVNPVLKNYVRNVY